MTEYEWREKILKDLRNVASKNGTVEPDSFVNGEMKRIENKLLPPWCRPLNNKVEAGRIHGLPSNEQH